MCLRVYKSDNIVSDTGGSHTRLNRDPEYTFFEFSGYVNKPILLNNKIIIAELKKTIHTISQMNNLETNIELIQVI